MKTYLCVYLGSALLAIMSTPLVIRIARWLGVVDSPGVRKVHSEPTPRIGGVAIFVSMIGLVVPVLLLPNAVGERFRLIQPKIIALLGAAGFVFLVGLVDDIKGLRVRIKLVAQIAAAFAVCVAGIRITSVPITASLTLELGWFSWLFTVAWIVGITNAINLSDGLDGLAAGISAIACGVIGVLAIYNGDVVMAILMLALLGSLTGFLIFNFEPAKIFMGDSGSFFLGFTIASASVLSATKTETIVGLALPILVLGIPILDTLFAILRRFLERRSPFAPDRSHFHHKLLALGLHQRHAVMTAYLVTFLISGLGMFMLVTRNGQTIVVFICTLLLLVLVFRVVGSVGLQETIIGLKRKYSISNQVKQEIVDFEEGELRLRQAKSLEDWWQAVSTAADKMGVLNLSLLLTSRDGTPKELNWRHESWTPDSDDDLLKVSFPVPDRRSGPPLKFKIEVYKNGSLQSAGRRVALFARLIDDHGLSTLPKSKRPTSPTSVATEEKV